MNTPRELKADEAPGAVLVEPYGWVPIIGSTVVQNTPTRTAGLALRIAMRVYAARGGR